MRFALALIIFALLALPARADTDHCAVCGGALTGTIFVLTDKVTNEKKQICHDCSLLTEICFACGLPLKANYTKLPDGRLLCARDASNAILNEDEAKQLCSEVNEALDRLFSRFLTFPDANVQTVIIDRVHLLELFKLPGNDYQCPVVLGYIQSELNQSQTHQNQFKHRISLLSALSRAEFKAVCAHEFTHAWLFENLPPQRKNTLGHDANEGFCELVAYLLMDAQHEEDQMKAIRRNNYTRGQIDLFIEAERRYGFNEIAEWMKYGADGVLNPADLNRIRNIETPSPTGGPTVLGGTSVLVNRGSLSLPTNSTPKAPVPATLVLRGISWNQSHPLALINNRTLGVNERARVRVGDTNVALRCLAIRTNSVVVQIEGRAEPQVLSLPEP